VQKLNPIYVWLSCAISFFMLIASNGMVELYKALADTEQYHQDHRDLKYDMQRVSNGIGAVVLLNIVLNVLDKVDNCSSRREHRKYNTSNVYQLYAVVLSRALPGDAY
jgi:hypothetical protein